MDIVSLFMNAISELLSENIAMKELLQNGIVSNLEEILSKAKADPKMKQVVDNYLAPLRTAISDEVDIERTIQELLSIPLTGKPN